MRFETPYQPQLAGPEDDNVTETETGTVTKPKPKTRRPSLYKVILLNDDYTPQEFVVWLLTAIFNKTPEEATRVMLHVHQNGVGICGIYTFEVAENQGRPGHGTRPAQ